MVLYNDFIKINYYGFECLSSYNESFSLIENISHAILIFKNKLFIEQIGLFLKLNKDNESWFHQDNWMIIGGSKTYDKFLKDCDEIIISTIPIFSRDISKIASEQIIYYDIFKKIEGIFQLKETIHEINFIKDFFFKKK